MKPSVSNLLSSCRFLPIFLTQALGAFSDNLFKNAFVILITYQIAFLEKATMEHLVLLASGIFILPFFLFSATAGQLADRFEKSRIIQLLKAWEIIVMLLASFGFLEKNLFLLYASLFLAGTQSALFGPLKYSILPDHLKTQELILGNALVEGSTFLSILIGTITGNRLIVSQNGALTVSALLLGISIIGFITSCFIPKTHLGQANLKIDFNIFRQTKRILAFGKRSEQTFLAILGISWLWFIGASFLTQFPTYTKHIIGASEDSFIYSSFVAIFAIGMAVGSLISARLLKNEISTKYVPFSILAMTFFIFDFYLASNALPKTSQLITAKEFLQYLHAWRIIIDLLAIAILGGIFSVPLYAILQSQSEFGCRSRVIAANNIMNALFMVISSVLISFLLMLHLSITEVFLVLAILNAAVAIYICRILPYEVMQSMVLWLFKLAFKLEVKGLENFKQANERTLIIANHVSFLDALILASCLPKKMVFAVNTYIAQARWVKPFLNLIDYFPIDPTSPMSIRKLIKQIKHENRHCMIFPEGRITVTGALMKVYEGPGMIADKAGASLLPIRIEGAQYSKFSRLHGKVRTRWFPKITVTILPPEKFIMPADISGRKRRYIAGQKLYNLMTHLIFDTSHYNQPLFPAIIDTMHIHGRNRKVLEDARRKAVSYAEFMQGSFVLANKFKESLIPHRNVGILLPTMVSTVVSFFALHIIGCVPAMLNFSAGIFNMLHACEIAKISTLITARQFIENAKLQPAITAFEAKGISIIYLEDIRDRINILDKLKALFYSYFPQTIYNQFNPIQKADMPAVVLFTSGSEGKPKGVVLSHKNIQANRYQLATTIGFSSQDIVFNALPIFHSFSLTAGVLLPILAGIKTFLYPSPLHYRIVPELIYDVNATIFFGTDTFLAGYARYANPYDFYSIHYVFAGGEKLKTETKQAWIDKFGIRLFEAYGATETAPALCINTPTHNKPGTVGKFLPNVQYRLEPISDLSRGARLYVRGPNVMLGYLLADNPGIIHPPQDNWYDTGDIVEIDDEGYVTILDRAKRFAKVAGEMVSLTAVEDYAKNCWPDANHAAIALPDERKGEKVILTTTQKEATREILASYYKKQGIADIALPKNIILLDKIPLLGSGKTDYVSLQKSCSD